MMSGLANLEAGDIVIIDIARWNIVELSRGALVDRAVWHNGELCFLRRHAPGSEPFSADRVPTYRGEIVPPEGLDVEALVADPRYRNLFVSVDAARAFVEEFRR